MLNKDEDKDEDEDFYYNLKHPRIWYHRQELNELGINSSVPSTCFCLLLDLSVLKVWVTAGMYRRRSRTSFSLAGLISSNPGYHCTWAHLSCILHESFPSVCVYVFLPVVGRQRLGKNVTIVTNTRARIELLDVILYELRVTSKESRWLVLSRTSCCLLFNDTVSIETI
jgi:hypothetical protein